MAVTAMILAAGFGTRLAPITDELPKALVPVAGKPMLAHAIEAVRRAGCDRIVVNAHHHADKMREHVASQDYGCEIILVEENEILGTGGGVLNARPYLEDAGHVLVHNVDILSDFDLAAMIHAHLKGGTLATLAVNRRTTTRAVMFDDDMQFIGKEVWEKEGMPVPTDALRFGFCGIHVISSEIFGYGFDGGFSDIFDLYRETMKQGAIVRGHVHSGYWTDLGTVERIREHEQAAR